MRCKSVGLEVELYLEDAELDSLRTNPLEGTITFRGVAEDADTIREIPFKISYIENQEDTLKVEQVPDDVYFGEAEKIFFQINGNYYHEVVEYKRTERRFFTGGKLITILKDNARSLYHFE